MNNRFNLIDEPWIPIVKQGLVSLKSIFSNPDFSAIAGNAVQKIALIKLLLAIVQTAYTPKDDDDWALLTPQGMANKSLEYLEKWHDRFWLYGDKPFLQMPVILELSQKNNLLPKPIGPGFYPDLPSENNTILTQSQIGHVLSDAEKALFIVTLMNFSLGGKRIDKGFPPFSPNFTGKSISAKAGPSIGNYVGYLHSHLLGKNVQETLWLNVLTQQQIEQNLIWRSSLGVPPWEKMPEGENCETARRLKNSYMGCLVAMSRFVLLQEDEIFYIEGIQYPSHKEGWREPSIAVNEQGKDSKLLWVNPNKRPWRELTALLSFINNENTRGFDCQLLRFGIPRARVHTKEIGVWSGGLRVRGNAGDQSVKQDDDFVASTTFIDCDFLGKPWFAQLKIETTFLEDLYKVVFGATKSYFKNQNKDGTEQAKLASNLFWQLCERRFQELVYCCDDFAKAQAMRNVFKKFAHKAYDTFCPKNTPRQLDSWAKYYPHFHS